MGGAGAATNATASVLFTDLVDSTALRVDVGDEAADEIRRAHDDAVIAAITDHGGTLVKSLGDGLMAVFDAAADAVAAAVQAQQGVARLAPEIGQQLQIRVGVSVGDVTREDGDVHGAAVDEAARLCGAAQGEQILVADLVRALARGRGGFTFESYGALDLKGIPEPVPACVVTWERPETELSDGLVPVPSALVPPSPTGYIGREDIRARLREVLDDTKTLGAQAVLLVGEPGIGKTRTAAELALEAARVAGATVLYGRCDDGLRAPYQPFVEALDWQTAHTDQLPLGRFPGELRRLVPDLASRLGDLPAMTASDARTEEHRLFEATASWLTDLALHAPVVLVLDDLHWATRPTLQLLLHVIRRATTDAAHVPLLVVGTYRDTDVDRAHPLADVLGDLRRLDGVHRVPIDSLDQDEVLALIEDAAGHELDGPVREVAIRAYEETDGNPFFVAEVLRHLVESGAVRFVDGRWVVPDVDHIDVPEGVRDVIGQRLSKLSDTTNDALRVAAVIGRDFDLELLRDVSGIDEDALLDALDEASRARLVEEVAADRFRFEHALVQTSLYEELSASRLRRSHRQIVDALEARRHPDLAALAHHAVLAGPRNGSLASAIGHVLGAAEHAAQTRATAEAETLFAKALELCEEDDLDPTDELHLRARLGVGAALRDRGRPEFREALLAVVDDARRGGHDDLLVAAALANTRGFTSIIGAADTERISALEAALAVEGHDEQTLADLEATLSAELVFDSGSDERRLALADRAIARCAAIDDPAVRARVHGMSFMARIVPERWARLVEIAQEGVRAADESGDPNLRCINRLGLQWAYANAGRLDLAAAANAAAGAIAREEAGPHIEWAINSQAAQFPLIAGDIEGATHAADAALEQGQQLGMVDAANWWAASTAAIEWVRTVRFGDPTAFAAFADQFPGSPAWRTGHAIALAQTGDLDGASELLDRFGLRDLSRFPQEPFWMNAMWVMALIAAELADVDLCHRVLEVLRPHADASVNYLIMPNSHMGWALAHVHLALGDVDAAIADFEAALDFAERQLPMHRPASLDGLAGALVVRDGPGDRERAADAWRRSIAVAGQIGAPGWIERAREGLAGLET